MILLGMTLSRSKADLQELGVKAKAQARDIRILEISAWLHRWCCLQGLNYIHAVVGQSVEIRLDNWGQSSVVQCQTGQSCQVEFPVYLP